MLSQLVFSNMSHNHNHSHGSNDNSRGRRLTITLILNFAIAGLEAAGGLLTGSLSLLSDSLHNLSDGLAVALSGLALYLKKRRESHRHTFGLKRAEIFAAFINSIVLVIFTLILFWHAAKRLFQPMDVDGLWIAGIASFGLVANIAGTLLLHRDRDQSLNLRSAYLHLLSDAVSSLAVLLGGLAIWRWQIHWLDPILTILIGIYILRESFLIVVKSVHILAEGTPPDMALDKIQTEVEKIPGVTNIHHVHVWSVGEQDIHLEAHVNVEDMLISESQKVREEIERVLKNQFKVSHITLQFECNQCPQVGLINNHAMD